MEYYLPYKSVKVSVGWTLNTEDMYFYRKAHFQ